MLSMNRGGALCRSWLHHDDMLVVGLQDEDQEQQEDQIPQEFMFEAGGAGNVSVIIFLQALRVPSYFTFRALWKIVGKRTPVLHTLLLSAWCCSMALMSGVGQDWQWDGGQQGCPAV